MNEFRTKLLAFYSLTLRTLFNFAQCLAFWVVALVIAFLMEMLGVITFPTNWYEPTLPFISAIFVSAVTYVLAASFITAKIKRQATAVARVCIWLIEGCNKNIGSVAINAAAVYTLMSLLGHIPSKGGLLIVLGCLVIAWFSEVLEYKSTREETSAQT